MKAERNYVLLCVIAFLQGFVFYGAISTVYRQARGLSIYEIFLIESIFMVLMVSFEIPWGWFADRFGYKTTMVCALFLSFLSKIVFFKAFSFELFLLERVLLGLSISGLSGCDSALLYNSVRKEHSERAFGRYYALSTLGLLFATAASTFIVQISMDLTAFMTIIPYGISVVAALFLREVKGETVEKPNIMGSLQKIFNNRLLLVFVIAVALVSEISHSVTIFLNQLQYQRVGIDLKYYGVILAALQLVTMLSAKVHLITGRLGQGKTVMAMIAIIGASIFLLIFTTSPIPSILLIAVVSLCNAMLLPISQDIQNKSITTSDRATILSVYAMTIDVVSAVINLAIGKTAYSSIRLSFAVCGVFAAAALLLSVIFFKRWNGAKVVAEIKAIEQ